MKESPEQFSAEKDYQALADKLDKMQATRNNGRGVSHVRTIVSCLRRGDINGAKAGCFNEGDKFGDYPDIKKVIIEELFAENEEHPWSLAERLKGGN